MCDKKCIMAHICVFTSLIIMHKEIHFIAYNYARHAVFNAHTHSSHFASPLPSNPFFYVLSIIMHRFSLHFTPFLSFACCLFQLERNGIEWYGVTQLFKRKWDWNMQQKLNIFMLRRKNLRLCVMAYIFIIQKSLWQVIWKENVHSYIVKHALLDEIFFLFFSATF